LRELAATLPQSIEALHGISGIGATKLERYGSALLDVMRTVIVPIA
jgi:superfamily II DNA helicase RecQ